MYSELFKSFHIGKCKIKNRITMAPMFIVGLCDSSGQLTSEALDYYEERAKGGVGLIFATGYSPNSGVEKTNFPSAFDNLRVCMGQTRKLSERLHAFDCKVFIQLAIGTGRAAFPLSLADKTPVAPSAVENRWDPSVICREATVQELETIVASVAQNALIAKMGGADGVEIHSVYGGYLGDQFAMTLFNHRTDEYGGDLKGRLKLATDCVKAVKAKCGKDFPVTLRFGIKHYMKGIRQGGLPGEDFEEIGRDTQESIEAAKILQEAGYDALNIANGSYDSWYWAHPPMYHQDGCWLEQSAILKKAVDIPVICAGKINDPQMANDAIKNGLADAIGLGRALLADAYWVKKANQGKPEDIRPCIACHNGCLARIFTGRVLACAVNADVGRELSYQIKPAEMKKNVCVIGGGIAGMEAARVAALRGHKVMIYEKGNELGGAVIAASVPAYKDADRKLIEWYKREIDKLGVIINFGCEMNVESIKALNADEIIVAIGAKPKMPSVPGIEQDGVSSAVDILLGKKTAGENCVVIGGGLVGCEIALWLKQQGKNVTVIEALKELMIGGPDEVCAANRLMLIDLLNFNKVNLKLNTTLAAIEKGAVRVVGLNGEETIPTDTTIISIGYYTDAAFTDQLVAEIPNVTVIGDSKIPSNIMYSVWDGAAVGRSV